jgi:hypothetical protein
VAKCHPDSDGAHALCSEVTAGGVITFQSRDGSDRTHVQLETKTLAFISPCSRTPTQTLVFKATGYSACHGNFSHVPCELSRHFQVLILQRCNIAICLVIHHHVFLTAALDGGVFIFTLRPLHPLYPLDKELGESWSWSGCDVIKINRCWYQELSLGPPARRLITEGQPAVFRTLNTKVEQSAQLFIIKTPSLFVLFKIAT